MESRRLRTIAPFAGIMNLKSLSVLSGQKTIFPFYHVVSDEQLPHVRHLYAYRNEQQFERDLEAMLKLYTPIGIDDYLKGRSGPGRKRGMVLSFDDGLVECHHHIAPLLKRKGIPAIFFLNNDFIDNRGLFYRYRAGILIDHLEKNRAARVMTAEFMQIPEEQVKEAILMINYRQIPLLDALMLQVDLDDAVYLRDTPVYMSTAQIRILVKWGFHIGAHSTDHPEFYRMNEKIMAAQVSKSMKDIQERFHSKPSCFAFPFTSDGVPERIIDELLDEGIADVIFGTAGMKKTHRGRFIQRIPMEAGNLSALRMLKAEHLYYLLKGLAGENEYFKGR
ncbi:MAG: polysaccharide deacetylase family protein [Bacteroidota bacterium]